MLRVLDVKEIALVSGGAGGYDSTSSMEDEFGNNGDVVVYGPSPAPDGSFASQYPDDEYYKTPTYVDSNGDIVVTAPEKDSLSNYDWGSWAEATLVTGVAAVATFGADTLVTGGTFAAGAAAGSPPATKALDGFNRYLYHNSQTYEGNGAFVP